MRIATPTPPLLGLSVALLACIGTSRAAQGPCDIYQAANAPCVVAVSTTRALYGAYKGPLYQVRRAKDNTLKDVPPLFAGGEVDVSVQDQFCAGTTCTISILYDQSPQKNDLVKSAPSFWQKNGGKEADASLAKVLINGHTAHGIYVTANALVGYRNNKTKGVATGNQAEDMYMVVDGKRYNSGCCFDWGNAETTGNDDGNGTMETIYWGTDVQWGGYGMGNGPWVAADLENGVFKGNQGGYLWGDTHKTPWPTSLSVIADYATALLKGPSTAKFGLKAGNAQTGKLTTMWDGARPSNGYSPKKLQGAIILGQGGDGSPTGTGTFFEGVMTIGTVPDSIDDKVQANIVAAGYGRTSTIASVEGRARHLEDAVLRSVPSQDRVRVEFTVREPQNVKVDVVDLQGRQVAVLLEGMVTGGRHAADWNSGAVRSGMYLARVLIDGRLDWSDKVVVGAR